MLSGVGPADHLKQMGIPSVQDLPGVGENLRDHPAVFLLYHTSEAIGRDAPVLQVGMRYTTPDSRFRNDMQLRPIQIRTEHIPVDFPVESGGTPTGFSIAIQRALSSGQIRLTSSDPTVQPSLDYRYLQDPYDRERLRGAVRLCAEITNHPEYGKFPHQRLSPTDEELASDEALDRWLLRNVATQHHSSGTCKMGPSSDSTAVVDQHGRVHGLEALRVVDASIMPDVIRANTNATTIMIAERISDWLR